jgi:hypothetical protein
MSFWGFSGNGGRRAGGDGISCKNSPIEVIVRIVGDCTIVDEANVCHPWRSKCKPVT